MDAGPGTVARLAHEIATALEPLRPLLASEEALREFVQDQLGIDAPEAMHALGIDTTAVDAVIDDLDRLVDAMSREDVDRGTVTLAAAALAADVAVATRSLGGTGTRAVEGLDPQFVAATDLVEALPRRLLDWLAVTHLEASNATAVATLRALGVVEIEPVEADPDTFTTEHTRRALHLDRLVALLTDPARWLATTYGWGTQHDALGLLLERLFALAVAFGIPARLGWTDLLRARALAGRDAFDEENDDAPAALRLPFLSAETTGTVEEAGLEFAVLPAHGALGAGLALLPFADGALDEDIALDEDGVWHLVVNATLDLRAGVGFIARPGRGLRLVADLDGEGADASGALDVRVTRDVSAAPVGLVTFGAGSGLFVTGVEARASAHADGSGSELLLEAVLKQARLRVSMDDADGFLQTMVPDLDLTFDAGLGVSTTRGAYFVGGAALEVARAINVQVGPVQLRQLALALRPRPQGEPAGIELRAGVAVALSIGPVTAVVDGVGARVEIAEHIGGNLGPVDVAIGFEPPSGIGLEVRSGPVNGGGFLFYDASHAQYAGVMELDALGIVVKAVGLLTTRLPGGAPGFSLLIVISAEFTPVQLGLGFRLEGVGGLLGINRTVSVEAMRAGLKSGALSAVLSPPDPVSHAAELVSALATLFPVAAGRHVFGPVARITWGTPTLVTIDLCLALEMPAPVRLVVLGRLRAILPDARAGVVRLQMDLVGVIDVDREEAAVDGTLVDSRLAGFALSGDMAMRSRWGGGASFLLAVGGFHPRFVAPPGFPALGRVAVALAAGNNPRVRLEAYLALTSNTVQFGARVDLLVKSGRFSVGGFLAFDALVTLSPLAFTVDIAGKLAVKAGGHTILSVSLALSLSGPEPWHARGRASFSLLFFDVSFGFDVRIGDDPPPALPSRVDVGPLLVAAFSDRRAWSAQLPAGGDTVVTIRAVDSHDVLAHPLGSLQVHQRVAPLERTLERFGEQVPSGERFFRIATAGIGAVPVPIANVTDLFAPAQFRSLTDEQKLSLPSFESMPSGAAIGTPGVAHGTPVSVAVVYEERIVPAEGVEAPAPATAGLPADVFFALTEPAATRRGGVFDVRRVS